MFLASPTTVDEVHHGDSHEDQRDGKAEGYLHRPNSIDCLKKPIDRGRVVFEFKGESHPFQETDICDHYVRKKIEIRIWSPNR